MYNINGIRVGATLERRIKSGLNVKSLSIKDYHSERESFKKAQEKQDLMEAPRTDIEFVVLPSGKTITRKLRTVGIVQLP